MTGAPILVTGSHKAGTTWVGEMLAASQAVGYISEPFNPDRPLGICGMERSLWFRHIPPGAQGSDITDYLSKTIAYKFSPSEFYRKTLSITDLRSGVHWAKRYMNYRRRHLRPLLKDPIAIFSAEWLAEMFDTQVVIVIRHPAAFADSLNRAGWRYDFSNCVRQPLLMEGYLQHFAEEIHQAVARQMTIIDQASLLWRIIYRTAHEYQQAYPNWYFVRHEDLSLDPIAEFQRLFDHCDLPFSTNASQVITEYSSGRTGGKLGRDSHKNATAWRNTLTTAEIASIRGQVEDVSYLYYADSEWG
jgi:hypothetical protein